jgi:mono/diheme cytochrome c family protein
MIKLRYVALFICIAGVANAETLAIKKVPVKLSTTTDGAQLYREHCAVCHGVDGKGAGPAAEALKTRPTDLTQLARKNGSKFPDLAVLTKIRGGDVAAHGSNEMPGWGKLLAGPGRAKTDADLRIYAVTTYLQQIQAQ